MKRCIERELQDQQKHDINDNDDDETEENKCKVTI